MKHLKYMKMSFKIKTMLAVNVQAHTNRFRQRLLEIKKKNNSLAYIPEHISAAIMQS